MKYYIDGYNLLFRFVRRDVDFSERRQQLIDALKVKGEQLGLELVLVFDAQYQQDPSTRIDYPCLQVLYTAARESADDRILLEIAQEKSPRAVTVITSDKKLAWFARRCEARTESVETFVEWFDKRCRNYVRKVKKENSSLQLKPISQPKVSKRPKECLDYYLKEFEKRNQDENLAMPIQEPTKSKRPSLSALEKAKKLESDFERWLRLFTSS